jgi:hypothetical protein
MDKDKVKASSMEAFEYKLAEGKVENKGANRMKGIARPPWGYNYIMANHLWEIV